MGYSFSFWLWRQRLPYASSKFVATILMFAIVGGLLVAHGQQSTADPLSDSDRARIIESVLDLERQTQASIPDQNQYERWGTNFRDVYVAELNLE
jgi:hypothetical protein